MRTQTLIAASLVTLAALPIPAANASQPDPGLPLPNTPSLQTWMDLFTPQQYLGAYLFAGDFSCDSDGYFCTIMQTDGNLVTYGNTTGPPFWDHETSPTPAWWAAGTWIHNGVTAALYRNYAVMQTDGNFVVYNMDQQLPWWATGTNGRGGDYIVQQNDGNLVIYTGPNDTQPIWWTRFEQPWVRKTAGLSDSIELEIIGQSCAVSGGAGDTTVYTVNVLECAKFLSEYNLEWGIPGYPVGPSFTFEPIDSEVGACTVHQATPFAIVNSSNTFCGVHANL